MTEPFLQSHIPQIASYTLVTSDLHEIKCDIDFSMQRIWKQSHYLTFSYMHNGGYSLPLVGS